MEEYYRRVEEETEKKLLSVSPAERSGEKDS
jgi:hypothetical protein